MGAQIGLTGNLVFEFPRRALPAPPIIVGRRRRSFSLGGGERGELAGGGHEEVDV